MGVREQRAGLLLPHIAAMTGYVYGEQPDDLATVKLNTNENPYPPSPAVQRVLNNLDAIDLRRYPDATAKELRQVIADEIGVKPNQVLATNGSDEGIRLLTTACLEPGATLVMTDPGYSLYPVLAAIQDARCEFITLDDDYQLSPRAATQCEALGARLVCIPNPNTPSGVLHTYSELVDFARNYSSVLLIDEAYVDFVDPEMRHDLRPMIDAFRHVVLLRTLSKGYSLAGLRLGFMLGHEDLIGELSSKVRDSYNVGLIPQRLAVAALLDQEYAQASWRRVRTERHRLVTALKDMGFRVAPSQANFILVEHPEQISMHSTFARLRDNNILVRYFDTERLRNQLRITVGRPEENDALLAALAENI